MIKIVNKTILKHGAPPGVNECWTPSAVIFVLYAAHTVNPQKTLARP